MEQTLSSQAANFTIERPLIVSKLSLVSQLGKLESDSLRQLKMTAWATRPAMDYTATSGILSSPFALK